MLESDFHILLVVFFCKNSGEFLPVDVFFLEIEENFIKNSEEVNL